MLTSTEMQEWNATNMSLHFILQHLDSSGSCLWTSAVLLIPSSRLCYRTNSPRWTCLTPPAGGSQTSCLTGGSMWSWGNMSRTPRPSAPNPLKDAFFPLYSSPCTVRAAPPVISPSSSWSLQMTPPSLDWTGAVRTTWSSILTSFITIWYAAATAKDKGRLQYIIHSAEKVIGCNLSSLQDLHTSRTLKRAGKIVANPSHTGHKLFEKHSPLPGGCGPSGPKLHTTRTVSSRLQLASSTRPKTPLTLTVQQDCTSGDCYPEESGKLSTNLLFFLFLLSLSAVHSVLNYYNRQWCQ